MRAFVGLFRVRHLVRSYSIDVHVVSALHHVARPSARSAIYNITTRSEIHNKIGKYMYRKIENNIYAV